MKTVGGHRALSENPYIPVACCETDSRRTKAASSTRIAIAHVMGALAFCLGVVSWCLVWQIPSVQPAFGGPDPAKVIVLLLTLTVVCGLLSIFVVIDALYCRRLLRLSYAVPAAAFVAFMVKLFAEMTA